MTFKYTSLAMIVIAIVNSTELASAQSTDASAKAYRKAMENIGLTPLLPASTAFRPGYIYTLVKGTAGPFSRTVCANAFVDAPIRTDVAFPKVGATADKKFNFSLNFLPSFLAKAVSAALGLNTSSSKTVIVNISGATTVEIPQSVSADTRGSTVKRIIDANCALELGAQPKKRDGSFLYPTFVVVTSTYADHFEIKTTQAGEAAANVSAKVTSAFTAKTGLELKNSSSQELLLTRPKSDSPIYYIAADVVQLTSDKLDTQVSGPDKPHTLGIKKPAPILLVFNTERTN